MLRLMVFVLLIAIVVVMIVMMLVFIGRFRQALAEYRLT